MTESVDNAETETPRNTPFYQENGRRIWARPFGDHRWNRDIFHQQVDTPEEDVLGRVYEIETNIGSINSTHQLCFMAGKSADGLINEDLIRVLIHRLGVLNRELPNAANSLASAYLQRALEALESRSLTRNRSSAWLEAALIDAGNEPGRDWFKAGSEVKDNDSK